MAEERKTLLVVAAGKATRFGGFPKAFANIGGRMNIENTISLASSLYDQIYVAVNKETYNAFRDIFQRQFSAVELFGIETGNGEAHSLLKALRHIRQSAHDLRKITVCWGDAYFLDDSVFEETAGCHMQSARNLAVTVFCSLDATPYAWFDLEGDKIKKIHFASEDGYVREGIHDQSLFLLDMDLGIGYLERYKEILGIGDEYEEGKEMKLLRSFEFLYRDEQFPAAECAMIKPGRVLAFNTKEEIGQIEMRIAKESAEGKGLC